MRQQAHTYFLLTILLLVFGISLNTIAQTTYSTVKSALVLQFANNIIWHNEDDIETFNIGFIGDDIETFNALQILEKDSKIKSKSIKIVEIQNTNNLDDINILFVGKSEVAKMNQIYPKVEKQNILLITDECSEAQYIMLNLVYLTNTQSLSFEINKTNLKIENFSINPELLLLGGTEVDVRETYHEMQHQLASQTETMLKQQDLLNSLTLKIKNKNYLADSLRQNITDLKAQISLKEADLKALNISTHSQALILEAQSEQINKQYAEAKQQNKEILQRQKSIAAKSAELDSLMKEAAYQKKLIAEQQALLQTSENLIAEQKKHISTVIVLAVALLLLGIAVLSAYRIKRRANRTLEEKVLARTIDLEDEIEERKLIENELTEAKHKAEESDHLKTAFLANMSHEIRTPMNGIMGFAQLLKEPKLNGEAQLKYLDIIEKSGQRMLNIINDLVDISKVEAGLMELSVSETNIYDQLKFIQNFFKPELDAKKLKFIDSNSFLPKDTTIFTDREKVYAILTNLVKNAIKYTHKGFVEIGCKQEINQLKFYVKDSGIGIAKDRQGAIFERFVQADIHDTQAYQGAGLGLSITKSYVEMLGGQIWVESELNEGSTFYFTIASMINPGHTKASPSEENLPKDKLKKLKVLVVEDDEVSEILLTAILSEIETDVLYAKSGLEAIDICKNNADIDLIMMDIKLPQMDGYQATRRIREFNQEVVIIAQSAYGLEDDKKKAIAAGCNDYISKPIKPQLLIQRISAQFTNSLA